jgi:hypothetical protein
MLDDPEWNCISFAPFLVTFSDWVMEFCTEECALWIFILDFSNQSLPPTDPRWKFFAGRIASLVDIRQGASSTLLSTFEGS